MKTRVRFLEGVYDVSFKRPRSGRLLNIRVAAVSICHASADANAYVQRQYPNKGWREYGISQATVVEGELVTYGSRGHETEWHELSHVGGVWRILPYYWKVAIDKEPACTSTT